MWLLFLLPFGPVFLPDSRSLRSKFQSCSCVVPSVFVLSPSCCSSFCVMFPLETVIPWELLAGVVYLRIVLFVEETPSIPLCFWKQTVQEKQQCGSFSVCFPHRSTAAVQTTLVTPVVRHSWTISRIICSESFKSLLPVSEESLPSSLFPGPSLHLVSTPDLSGLGEPPGSSATAGLALTVMGTRKPLHYGNMEIPLARFCALSYVKKKNTFCNGQYQFCYLFHVLIYEITLKCSARTNTCKLSSRYLTGTFRIWVAASGDAWKMQVCKFYSYQQTLSWVELGATSVTAGRARQNALKSDVSRLWAYWVIILWNQYTRFPKRPNLKDVNNLPPRICVRKRVSIK